MREYRNHLSLRYQLVCSLVNGANPFTEPEILLLSGAFRSAARTLHCFVEELKVGATWVEASLVAGTGFDLAKTAQVMKSTSSRQLHGLRPAGTPIWAPGYAAATLGQQMDAQAAAAKLARGGSANDRKGGDDRGEGTSR